MKSDFRPSQILEAFARRSESAFMPSSDLPGAMEALSRARVGFADEENPTCLFPVSLETRPPFSPVACGAPADRGSHSIQEKGPLLEISTPRGAGPCVFQFFPDLQHMVNQTRGESRRIASVWPWDIESVPPREVPITRASIGHFADNVHDQVPYLGGADNLVLPDVAGYVSFDDSTPPDVFEGLCGPLFDLAHRTLLFRISQFRGSELEMIRQLDQQRESGNRFGIRMCLESFVDLSSIHTEILRIKDGFDRRILEEGPGLHLIHHVVSFVPVIPYAASEFMPIPHISYRGVDHVWASVNVLPIDGRVWLIVSHLPPMNLAHLSLIRNWVLDFAASNDSARRQADFGAFASWTNLFASINHYLSLSEFDRKDIESRVANQVCEDPFVKALKILRSSPGGAAEVARIEEELRGMP